MTINTDYLTTLTTLASTGSLTDEELQELSLLTAQAQTLVDTIKSKHNADKYRKYFSSPTYSITYDSEKTASSIRTWDLYKVEYVADKDHLLVTALTYNTTIGGDVGLMGEGWVQLQTNRWDDIVEPYNMGWVYDHVKKGLLLTEDEYNKVFIQLTQTMSDINVRIALRLGMLNNDLDTIRKRK
jgi:hypothetical protein